MKFLDNFIRSKNKVQQPSQNQNVIGEQDEIRKKENERSHIIKGVNMWWVISLMTIIIIAMGAHIYNNQVVNGEKIISYLEFAATLLSIVLSIFAIFYSYFSALEASRQWGDVSTAVKIIENTTATIESNNQMMLATMIAIHGEVNSLGGEALRDNNMQPKVEVNSATINNIQNNATEDNLPNIAEDVPDINVPA